MAQNTDFQNLYFESTVIQKCSFWIVFMKSLSRRLLKLNKKWCTDESFPIRPGTWINKVNRVNLFSCFFNKHPECVNYFSHSSKYVSWWLSYLIQEIACGVPGLASDKLINLQHLISQSCIMQKSLILLWTLGFIAFKNKVMCYSGMQSAELASFSSLFS